MTACPWREISSSLSISSWRISSIERKSPATLGVRDVEQHALRVLDQLPRLAAAVVDLDLDLLRDVEQPAHRGLLLDQVRVVAGVAGGRDRAASWCT